MIAQALIFTKAVSQNHMMLLWQITISKWEMPYLRKWGGDRKSNLHDAILKLSDLEIEPTASHRWQRLFDIPEEHLVRYIAE